MKGVPEAVGRCLGFACFATHFAAERVTGIEPALSAWGEVLSPPCSPLLQRFWRTQLAPSDPYRPGLVARAWPGSRSLDLAARWQPDHVAHRTLWASRSEHSQPARPRGSLQLSPGGSQRGHRIGGRARLCAACDDRWTQTTMTRWELRSTGPGLQRASRRPVSACIAPAEQSKATLRLPAPGPENCRGNYRTGTVRSRDPTKCS
jgi:hypothetical protein